MASETHVFFRGKLPTKAALAKTMRELGFPFSLKPATGSLEQQSGFMPMTLRGEETGVAFDVFEGRAAVNELAPEGGDAGFDRSANFRWSGDEHEMLAGLCAAAALAKLTNGVVFDETEGRVLSVAEAIAVVRRNYEVLKPEERARPGTRPSDIRRYLKPLLRQRSDLLLRGRLLIIRPVRHVLRGAFFDRTSDKHQFRIWRYIKPLYQGPHGLGHGSSIYPSKVWEPHFEHELLDSLAHDIFDHVGRLTTLTDVVDDLARTDESQTERVVALVLTGERERAADYVTEMERKRVDNSAWEHWAKGQRSFLARDIGAVCEEYRSKEAQTADALKLGDAWIPSPFPAELPPGQRATRSSEPAFTTTPWVKTPDWLVQGVPERAGEIRFARKWISRGERILLLVPLTDDEAECLHRGRQEYVLATRLNDGSLVLVRHSTSRSLHDAERTNEQAYVPLADIHVKVITPSYEIVVWLSEDLSARGWLELLSIDVRYKEPRYSRWRWSFDSRENAVRVHDNRPGGRGYSKHLFARNQHAWHRFPSPQFGARDQLLQWVRAALVSAGCPEGIQEVAV